MRALVYANGSASAPVISILPATVPALAEGTPQRACITVPVQDQARDGVRIDSRGGARITNRGGVRIASRVGARIGCRRVRVESGLAVEAGAAVVEGGAVAHRRTAEGEELTHVGIVRGVPPRVGRRAAQSGVPPASACSRQLPI